MTLQDYLSKMQKTDLVTIDNLPVRVKKGAERQLEVLGAPYGGHNKGKDEDGEWFSENTDFMIEVGDRRPTLYLHGMTPRMTTMLMPEVIGKATAARRDQDGLWFDVALGEGQLADRVWEAALEGKARASSGAVNYLVRKSQEGEILSWPLAELSVFDTGQGRQPANQLASVSLKAAFDSAEIDMPESFVKSGELETELVQEDESDDRRIIIKR